LAVPFCGDYVEANIWTDAEKAEHARAQAQRVVADAADAAVLRRLGAGK
jgi:Trk K+ transport system NAD-binding subunit